MRRNPHVRFLGGREVAILPAYPTFFSPLARRGRQVGPDVGFAEKTRPVATWCDVGATLGQVTNEKVTP